MATIDNRATIDRIIESGGRLYEDEQPVVKIIEYTNAFNRCAWGVVWEGEADINRYQRPTEYVRDPKVIWQRPGPQPTSDRVSPERTPWYVLCPACGHVGCEHWSIS